MVKHTKGFKGLSKKSAECYFGCFYDYDLFFIRNGC